MIWLLQQAAERPLRPWTSAEIHDTVATIAAQPIYSASVRQSLIGRFLRYVLDHLVRLLNFFRGSLDARIALYAVAILVAAVIVSRIIIAERLREARRRRALGFHARPGARIDFWAVARDEAANGRYASACHAIYAAVIDTFARQGMMAFHASKTSGDYARDLRRAGAPFVGDFRMFARYADRALFGTSSVTVDDYHRLRELAERVARVAVPT